MYGPESSGKTTLALHILAEAQKKGGEVAFIDVEHALDPTYAWFKSCPPYAIEIAQKKGAAAMEQIIESERYACVRTGDVEEKM